MRGLNSKCAGARVVGRSAVVLLSFCCNTFRDAERLRIRSAPASPVQRSDPDTVATGPQVCRLQIADCRLQIECAATRFQSLFDSNLVNNFSVRRLTCAIVKVWNFLAKLTRRHPAAAQPEKEPHKYKEEQKSTSYVKHVKMEAK